MSDRESEQDRSADKDVLETPEPDGAGQGATVHRKVKPHVLRGITAAAMFAVVGAGLALHTGTGTLSSMGVDYIATICPLGALETLFGVRAFVPRLIIALAVMAVAVWLVGKAFCSFVCPVPHVQSLFKTKKRRESEEQERTKAAQVAVERYRAGETVKRPAVRFDSRHAVLGASLFSAAVFGFPVFCLVCPVGLTIATLIALWQLVQFNELTVGLLVFPAVALVEAVVLRRWCGTLCPMGALFSLIAAKNRTFRPTVDRSKCLRDAQGKPCGVCAKVCGEHADPHSNLGMRPMSECVKCGACVENCPVNAISFKFLPKEDREKDTVPVAAETGESSRRSEAE